MLARSREAAQLHGAPPRFEELRVEALRLVTMLGDGARPGGASARSLCRWGRRGTQSNGAADDVWARVALLEALSETSLAGAIAWLTHLYGVLPLVAGARQPEFRERFADPGLEGSSVFSRSWSCVAGPTQLRLRHEGTGIVLDGSAVAMVNAAGADAHCVVDRASGTVVMVPSELPGVELGAPLLPGEPVAHDVRFRRVSVPAGWVVSPDLEPGYVRRISLEVQSLAACMAITAASRYLDAAVAQSHTRESFGVPLRRHQSVRLRLADLRARVAGCRSLAYGAVSALEAARPSFPRLAGAAIAKADALLRLVAEECLVLHGAQGYEEHHLVAGFVTESRLLSLVGLPGSENGAMGAVGGLATDDPTAERAAIRATIAGQVLPRLPDWAAAPEFPVRDALAVLADKGILGIGFPPEHGGCGGGVRESSVLHEELGRLRSTALAGTVLSHLEVGTRLVLDHAKPAVVERWVPAALAGSVVIGYAATEVTAGSDLAATVTSGRREGSHWVIDGAKKFISNGHQADALCVLVRTSDRSVTSHSLFLVPMDTEGASTRSLATLGNRGTLAEVRLRGVRVESEALLGVEGQGLLLQVRRLAHERAFVAVVLAAAAGAALEALTTTHSKGSTAFDNQLECLVADVEEARLLAKHAIDAVAASIDARVPAAMAKLVASRVLRCVTDVRLRIGVATGDPGDHMQGYLDALGFALAGGTDNMLLEAISR